MNYNYIDKELKKINIDLISNYLIKHKWIKIKDFPNKKLIHFKKMYYEDEFNINIPASEKFKDFESRVKDAIYNISVLENKNIEDIIDSIITPQSEIDSLSVRIISEISKDGKIPLEYGKNIIEGMSRLIIATIANENNPKPYFSRINKNSFKVLESFQLSQTSVGSYIFNIEVENTVNEQLELDKQNDNSISPQRSIIKRIQTGLNDVSRIKTKEDIEKFYIKGLNANMCDALLNFKYGEHKVDIETSITWANGLEKPKDIPEKILISNEEFNTLEKISMEYKQVEKLKKHNVKGYIIRLESPKNKKGETIGRDIVMQVMINNQFKNIKVFLNENDYKKALDAHKKDLIVSVEGEIEQKGNNKLEISKYDYFEVY